MIRILHRRPGLLAALLILLLTLTGAALVARRAGGWRRWFAALKGNKAGRLHVKLARVAVVGRTLSALWMSAETFELIEITPAYPGFAEGTKDAAPIPLAQMPALAEIPVADLRDGFVEIVVKKQSGGLCSGQLMALDLSLRGSNALRTETGAFAHQPCYPLLFFGFQFPLLSMVGGVYNYIIWTTNAIPKSVT